MAELLQIEEPGRAKPPAPQWTAFLELGFRPLYLAGCFWAAVSVALWVFAPGLLRGQLPGVIWHAHEMLWGFIATIAVGFLLTAGSNWTGINPLKGRALGALSLLWVLARAGYLVPGTTAFGLAAICELLFFVWAAAALGRTVYMSRNRRNYGVPLLVLALGLADALFLLAAWAGDHALLMQRFNTGLLCMAVIALLVARRVIPFFAMRAVPGLTVPMHTRSGHWQLAVGGLAIACGLLGWSLAAALFLAVAGAIALVQVMAWKPWAVRRVPLLWILYVGYAALGAGLLVAAAHASGWPFGSSMRAAWPAHVIGVAAFSVLIIGMVTRTALGHLGRPLRTDRLIVCCYALVIAAAALRLWALLPSNWTLGLLHASAGAWVLAFALYLWRFFPMLIRPRIDQAAAPVLKPGQMPVRQRPPP
jgi:uncharacterized protein involved in response to NO